MIDIGHIIYSDGVIEIGLTAGDPKSDALSLGIRWLQPIGYRDKSGKEIDVTNIMGGETDWFLLPHTIATAVGKRLIEQRATGLNGFEDSGFQALVGWLVEQEELPDGMAY